MGSLSGGEIPSDLIIPTLVAFNCIGWQQRNYIQHESQIRTKHSGPSSVYKGSGNL
jgi:hypothetical protein